MGQITLQKFKRHKVVSALPEPEIYIEGEQISNDVLVKVKLDFKESKNYFTRKCGYKLQLFQGFSPAQ